MREVLQIASESSVYYIKCRIPCRKIVSYSRGNLNSTGKVLELCGKELLCNSKLSYALKEQLGPTVKECSLLLSKCGVSKHGHAGK